MEQYFCYQTSEENSSNYHLRLQPGWRLTGDWSQSSWDSSNSSPEWGPLKSPGLQWAVSSNLPLTRAPLGANKLWSLQYSILVAKCSLMVGPGISWLLLKAQPSPVGVQKHLTWCFWDAEVFDLSLVLNLREIFNRHLCTNFFMSVCVSVWIGLNTL